MPIKYCKFCELCGPHTIAQLKRSYVLFCLVFFCLFFFCFVCLTTRDDWQRCEALLDEKRDEELLNPGIHAIMSIDESLHPTTLRAQHIDKNPLFNIILFYWPVNDAFDMPSDITRSGITRSNVSCLYLRILHEITDRVVVPVSMNEVRICFPHIFLRVAVARISDDRELIMLLHCTGS